VPVPEDGVVRRTLTFTAAWLVAAAIALAVAWQGVGIVAGHVTEDRPAPLTAADIRRRAVAATGQAGAAPDGSAPPTSVPGTSPTTTATVPSSQGVSTTTTTVKSRPPATSPTTSTSVPPPAAETRTYTLVGGSASLRFTASGVTVVWANPNPGFEVEVEPENVNGVKVEFESDSHRSRVDGWWDGGPQDRVREEDR
jgi:hypothetical protein